MKKWVNYHIDYFNDIEFNSEYNITDEDKAEIYDKVMGAKELTQAFYKEIKKYTKEVMDRKNTPLQKLENTIKGALAASDLHMFDINNIKQFVADMKVDSFRIDKGIITLEETYQNLRSIYHFFGNTRQYWITGLLEEMKDELDNEDENSNKCIELMQEALGLFELAILEWEFNHKDNNDIIDECGGYDSFMLGLIDEATYLMETYDMSVIQDFIDDIKEYRKEYLEDCGIEDDE